MPAQPILVQHIFRPLDKALITLLESLNAEDWNKQTVAKQWKVKDVAAHLLDGNIRLLSVQRDKYFGEAPPAINSYQDLVNWLNDLNADWVKAAKRMSPAVLTMLLKLTSDTCCSYYESLNLYDEAIFAVSWAGEDKSLNWMHIAREYTERWHHQQQIREAVGKGGIMTKAYYYPFIDTFFRGLPHTFKDVNPLVNTSIKVTITTEAGGNWYLRKLDTGWELYEGSTDESFTATVSIPPQIAWKLFSKSIRPGEIINHIEINGDSDLAMQVLNMVAVMA